MIQAIKPAEDAADTFGQIDEQLLTSAKPSDYLQELGKTPVFSKYPFSMLDQMKRTGQSPEHHPEGNVWNHTLLVVDSAAAIKEKSSDPRIFMWAALLHDIGKPGTTKRRNGRITSYDHDKLGAKLAKEFLESFGEEQAFIESVSALVRWHMQILFVVKSQPYADIVAMKRQCSVTDVALLGLCDRFGRKGLDEIKRKTEEQNIRQFLIFCGESQAVDTVFEK